MLHLRSTGRPTAYPVISTFPGSGRYPRGGCVRVPADWRAIVLALAVAWAVQALLTYRQILHYRTTLQRLYTSRSRGFLGSGRCRQGWRGGAVVVLLADEKGTVVDAWVLRGASVFARFQREGVWNGRHVREIAMVDPSDRSVSPIHRAASEAARQVITRMTDGN